MLQFSENAGVLTIYTPIWAGVVAIALGVVVLGVVAWRSRAVRQTITAGGVVVALALFYGGLKLVNSTITLHPAGIIVETPFGDEMRYGWSQVARHEIEDRSRGRYLVFVMRSGDWFEIRISDLTPAEGKRVLEFARAHSKSS